MLFSLLRSRRSAVPQTRRQARYRRDRGSWGALGGVASGLAEVESLESRIALAADLATEFVEPSAYYVPGSPARYVVTVINLGNESATNVAFSTNLASQFTSRTWTAVYSGGASGPRSGSGNVSTGNTINLPVSGAARFTIDGIFAPSAEGNATSSATATVSSEVDTLGDNTATNTREQADQAIAVSDDLSRTSGGTVRVVDAASGEQIRSFTAYAGAVRGVQTVMADMTRNGRPEIVTAPLRGGSGEIRVFTAEGVELEKYRLTPFGSTWSGGLSVAVGDFDGDGLLDVAAAKASGDGEVRVFRGTGEASAPLEATPWRTIRPFASTFLGGASIAAADMGTFSSGTIVDAGKQDGRAELIIANGPGAAPEVRVYDMSGAGPKVIDTIRPFSPGFFGGVSVATGRVNADGIPDLILSAGRRGNSATEIYDGRVGSGANAKLASFAAFTALGRSPAATTATAIDTNGDGRIDTIYSSQGSGGRGSLTELNPSGGLVTRLTSFTGPTRAVAPAVVGDPTLVTTASGLQYRDLTVGTGNRPSSSTATVRVNYEGRLLDGTRFDGNTNSTFALNGVIKGWTEGLASMRVGGRRQLIIPAVLGYGGTARTGIPANSTLVFDVELLSTT